MADLEKMGAEQLLDELIKEAATTQCEPCISKARAELLRRLGSAGQGEPCKYKKAIEDAMKYAGLGARAT